MRNERVTFPGRSGAPRIGRLSLPPDGEVVACALFVHCFACAGDLTAADHISRALTQARIGVLRLDFTGLGDEDRPEGPFSSCVDDLVAAADWLERTVASPVLLVGHSLGGVAVLHAAARIPAVRAVATIGAPFDAASVLGSHPGATAEAALAGRRFRLSQEFVRDLGALTVESAVRGLRRPLLVFHSPVDRVVPMEDALRIEAAAVHPTSFVSLDGADHFLGVERDSLYVGSVLAAWAGRYVEAPRAPSNRDELRADGRVAARTGAGAYRTEIVARRHALVADEPRAVGGEDLGPTPYDLVAAALGACTTMTLRMYADRKGWPLEEVVARVRHSKIHGEDEERCESREARLDRLEREIELTGPLDAAQRARLLEIADRCPVHRTLSAGVRMETRLAAADAGVPRAP